MFAGPAAAGEGDRADMSPELLGGALIAHMSGADVFGLVVTVLIIAYLFYALIRGEKLSDLLGLGDDRAVRGHPDRARDAAGELHGEACTPASASFSRRCLAGPERLLYAVLRVDPKHEQDWKAYAKSLLVFSLAGWLLLYRDPAHPERVLRSPRAEPARLPLGAVERHLQHRLVVCDEHELAVLRRRDHDELPQPDDRADGAELALGWRRASSSRSRSSAASSVAAARGLATSGPTSCARSCTCWRRSR